MGFRSYRDPHNPRDRKKIDVKAKPKRLRKSGPLTPSEKFVIAEIVRDTPGDLDTQQLNATAIVLARSPQTIASHVIVAREKLQQNAARYVDIHMDSVEQALVQGDVDVARKGSEWAMTNISAKDARGKAERIVDAPVAESTAPRIAIGINLGGLPSVKH